MSTSLKTWVEHSRRIRSSLKRLKEKVRLCGII